jgi:hypothetical protein
MRTGLRCSFYIGDGQNNQLERNLPCVTCPTSTTLDLLSCPQPLEICALPPINSCRLVSSYEIGHMTLAQQTATHRITTLFCFVEQLHGTGVAREVKIKCCPSQRMWSSPHHRFPPSLRCGLGRPTALSSHIRASGHTANVLGTYRTT